MGGVIGRLVLVAALAATACAPRMRDRGFEAARSTADALDAALEPRQIALVIGIDAYDDPQIPALRHAAADATALADVLGASEGGFHEVVALTAPGETSRDDVLRALRRLRATVRHEDEVVVYFSGHGTRLRDGDRWRRFLLPADTASSDLHGTALDLEAIQRWFAGLPSARKALVVDACFSGDGRSALGPVDDDGDVPDDALVPRAAALGSGESHLYATSAGRPSREDDRLGHGVYTYHLLDAMTAGFDAADRDRDGVLTAWEAHDHARVRTIAHTDGVQVPEVAFRVLGEADLVLAGDPGRRRAREQALFYLYASGDDDGLASASIVVDGRDRGAFPGTVPLEPGRRHVVLEDADGSVLLEGWATFRPGRAYRADDIQRIVQGPRRLLGVRAAVTTGALPQVLGGGGGGVEAYGISRFARGPLHGLYGEAFAGFGVAPTRHGDAGTLYAPRSLSQAGLAVGLQGDVGRLRLRGGWGASAVVVPPSYPDGRPDDGHARAWEAGWWLAATGPSVGIGYSLGGPWTLTATGRAHGTRLDPWGTGRLETQVLSTAGLGVEASF